MVTHSNERYNFKMWKFAAWMDRYGGDYDVILVDWHNLAWFLQVETY